jgi:hypothetical protein
MSPARPIEAISRADFSVTMLPADRAPHAQGDLAHGTDRWNVPHEALVALRGVDPGFRPDWAPESPPPGPSPLDPTRLGVDRDFVRISEVGMRVSGFSMVRDAVRLHYPVAEAIRSILPLCDEFVIAVGRSQDGTVDRIRALNDPKVRILETEWDPAHFVHGAINAVQSNLALDQCTGDWAFYLQADEVVHEEDLPGIRSAMEANLNDPQVEGLLFRYLHFWGTDRVQWTRNWYRHETGLSATFRNAVPKRAGFRLDGQKLRSGIPEAGSSTWRVRLPKR